MELPRRERGDELLPAGELLALRRRLRNIAPRHDLKTVIACAFDHRSRMLPFIYADTRMVPAGVRAIGSALADIGCEKTRIVLQQWKRHFRPALMRLDGAIPDLFLVSTMGMHSGRCMELIHDARRIDAKHRPLIIAGGSHAIYEPHLLFDPPGGPGGADVAVTGEEFVFLSLLELLFATRGAGESLRAAFYRARDGGLLDHIPGLVYPLGRGDGTAEELVNTGTQRLLGDLDELPLPTLGYRLLEPPGGSAELGLRPLAAGQVRRYSPISSLVMTFGCKFACAYCPIPAYNQRQHRLKSGARIAEEMWLLHKEFGLRYFFGVDDNFFNRKDRALAIVEALARAEFEGVPLRRHARWYTEVTVHDTLEMKDHLQLVRDAGCRALWLGVEDMTANLVNKGQTIDKTTEAFQRLRRVGICPMPMMMHHDSQPLYSRGTHYGLLNQVRLLRRAGAVSLQVLMITPSVGTRLFEKTFADGQVLARAGGRPVEPYMWDGNFVIASHHPRPWRQQVNLLLAYLYFYNPLWLALHLLRHRTRVGVKPVGMQLVGMLGLVQTIRRTFPWALRLMFGRIVRQAGPPVGNIKVRGVHAVPASSDVQPTAFSVSRLPVPSAKTDDVPRLLPESH